MSKCSIKNRPTLKPRISKEEWIARCSERYNTKYNYDKVNYVDQHTPVQVVCPKHGEFSIKPVAHLHKGGCPKCGRESTLEQMGNRRDTYSFINELKEIYGDSFDYSEVIYRNNTRPITIRCTKHGEFLATPKLMLNGSGCPMCNKEARSVNSQESFIKKAKEVHGDKYDYSKLNYISASRKVIIICPEHGEFEQRADTHLGGHGCPECGHEGRKLTNDEFKERVKELHPELILDDKTVYKRGDLPITVKCKEHGYFDKIATDLMRTRNVQVHGCSICSSSKGEKRVFRFLRLLGVEFIRQYKFPNSNYRYDFYIPSLNILIEYDGIQHYKPIDLFGGKEAYDETVKVDRIKEELASKNGFRLIRIPYNAYSNLERYALKQLSLYWRYGYEGKFYKSLSGIKHLIGDNSPDIYRVENIKIDPL